MDSEILIEFFPKGEKTQSGFGSVTTFSSSGCISYVMVLDAGQIIKAYDNSQKDQIFSLNIRNYIGNNKVNKEIIKTALNEPDKFFMFNNGISCLASKITVNQDKVVVAGLKVINGAQTVRALYEAGTIAQKSDHWKFHSPHIVVRITEIEGEHVEAEDFRERVTQYNNTQNLVKGSDFRTNDTVHDLLSKRFGKLSRFGKRVIYQSKRSNDVFRNAEIIKMDEFAKSIYTFLYNFVDFSSSSQFLYDRSLNGGYLKVFGDGESGYKNLSDAEFELFAGIYWLTKEISEYLEHHRSEELDKDFDAWQALEKKWILIYTVADVMKFMYPEDRWKDEVRKLFKGDWKIGEDNRGEAILELYIIAKKIVVQTYKNSKKFQKSFVHADWMKAKETPLKIHYNVLNLVPTGRRIEW